MARQRMVTRTVVETVARVMTVKVSTATVTTLEFTIPGEFETTDSALIALKKRYEDSEQKLVAMTGMSTKETLYGMPESDFITLARVLPPRTKQESEEE